MAYYLMVFNHINKCIGKKCKKCKMLQIDFSDKLRVTTVCKRLVENMQMSTS